jgi:hypothetical protein
MEESPDERDSAKQRVSGFELDLLGGLYTSSNNHAHGALKQ